MTTQGGMNIRGKVKSSPTIQCTRCGVHVPLAALELIRRCLDSCCPLNHSRAFMTRASGCCEGEQAQPEKM